MWNGLIPVNTVVALGTKTQRTYRSLSGSCSLYATSVAAIENGDPIHVILHSRHGGTLAAGQDVDFVDICNRSDPAVLAADGRTGAVLWRHVREMPSGRGTWTVETGQAPGTPIDILQSVRLVLTSNPTVHISAGPTTSNMYLSDNVEETVRFYFTNPASIQSRSIPDWVPLWYSDFQTHQQWLLTRSQTTPLHTRNHRKWHTPAPPRASAAITKPAATDADAPAAATYSISHYVRDVENVAGGGGARKKYHIVRAALAPSAAF
jgi:hypothetical protein